MNDVHHSIDPIAVQAAREEADPLVSVECGKCCEVYTERRSYVQECVDRRRKISPAAAYYKCSRCYL